MPQTRKLLWAAKYAWLTIQHKWWVFLAGLKLGVPLWQLIIHDFSKFGRHELFAYGRQFFGDKGDPLGFQRAWLHHQNHNPHHWEYWIPRTNHVRSGIMKESPIVMPLPYIREMVADWMGASKAYTGSWDMTDWLEKNLPLIGPRLNPVTIADLKSILKSLGYGHLAVKLYQGRR